MFVAKLLAVVVLSIPASAADSPFAGAWKLNLAKSTTSSWEVVRSRNQIFQVTLDGYRVTTGRASSTLYCDGQDRPRDTSSASLLVGAETMNVECVNAHVIKTTYKRMGKPVATVTRTLSPDGFTMTTVVNGFTAKGEKLHSVLVYERN